MNASDLKLTGKWKNFGDVSFMEYDGLFVQKDDPKFPHCYYVIWIVNMEEATGDPGFAVSDCYINLTDDWMNLDDVRSQFDGLISESQLAANCVTYYGPDNFGTEHLFKNAAEAANYLRGYEIIE